MTQPGVRLHYIDTLRAFVMSIGVVLHAGLVAPFWLAKSVNYVSGMFRMNLFVFVVGFFVALLVGRRGYDAVVRDRLIRFGVPSVVFIGLVAWIEHYYFYNLFIGPASPREIIGRGFAWTVSGFDWPGAPRFMTWHGHMWFLLTVLVYCLLLRGFLRLASSVLLGRAAAWLAARPPRTASLLLALLMAGLLLGGRTMHFLTTQQLLGGGPFNFIAQQSWVYSSWFLLGIVAFRTESVMVLLHRPFAANVVGAAVVLAAATALDPLVRARFGVIGGDSLKFFSRGLMGFYICVTLLWAFRRWGDRHSSAVRFLSDASYTVYLFHVTVIAVAGYYLRKAGVPAPVTWAVVIVITYPVCLAVHRLLVDRNPLTRLVFNGKPLERRPRPATAS